jgi:transcriptional regulator with GAF, ATPase, and Fis domain
MVPRPGDIGLRCIVPVDGFFEWKAIKGRAKHPYAMLVARRPMCSRCSTRSPAVPQDCARPSNPDMLPVVAKTGFRSALAVPMLREGAPIGAVAVGRMQVRAFTDAQIKLLETFADQAVIAIENTRFVRFAPKATFTNQDVIRRFVR